MKALAVAGIALILASCTGETTVIREVQVTTAPEQTSAPVEEPSRISRAHAIATARESVPSLWDLSDDTMESLMMTSCESIDSWAPDYQGYLDNAREMLSRDSSQRDEIIAIIVASIFSVCTEHQIGITDVLDGGSVGY